MSPFRDAPPIELGPLEVGLIEAAVRAASRLPRGGRLVAMRAERGAAHTMGALGSVGVLTTGAVVFVIASTGWRPTSNAGLLLCVLTIAAGGLSLATVLRAFDRHAVQPTRRGAEVGRAARAVLDRMARVADEARRGPALAEHVAALRGAIARAEDPELVPWIPRDVRGRAELLLARVVAATTGPAWSSYEAPRREVRALLVAATWHLDDATPAQADLAAMAPATGDRLPAPTQVRFLPEWAEAEAEAAAAEAEALAHAELGAAEIARRMR